MKPQWEPVGVIGVDSGLCWIGDPSYCVTPDAPEHPANTWETFLEKLDEKQHRTKDESVAQWFFGLDHPGLGVSIAAGGGDGVFPVLVRRNHEGQVIEARVIFLAEEAE